MQQVLFILVAVTSLVVAFPSGVLKKYLSQEGNFGSDDHKRNLLGALDAAIVKLPKPVTVGRKALPDSTFFFKAKANDSQRGVCPGMNLLANYGCISRSGIDTLPNMIYGQMECLGFAYDLAAALAVVGVSMCGDVRSQKLSIGGPDVRTLPTLNRILGEKPACGLNFCHNKFEVDMSLSRDDAYFHNGDATVFSPIRWTRHKEIADNTSNGNWDLAAITKMRDDQFDYCVANNPKCTHNVFNLLLNAGQNLVNLAMPSATPNGFVGDANYTVVSTFFGVSGNNVSDYKLTVGNEKLPITGDGKWYRQDLPVTLGVAVTFAVVVFFRWYSPTYTRGQRLWERNELLCT